MKYAVRLRDDRLDVVVVALLIAAMVLAIARGFWIPALIAFLFLVTAVAMWIRKANARWCTRCNAVMDRVELEDDGQVRVYYLCRSCKEAENSVIPEKGREE